MMWAPEILQQWVELQKEQENQVVVPKRKRCGGCGRFLPKDMTWESYMSGEPYHMKERCMTNGVRKMRAKSPDWDWPTKKGIEND